LRHAPATRHARVSRARFLEALEEENVDGRIIQREAALRALARRYFFAFRFLAAFRFFAAFFGTFLPSALASESPIAIACLRLLTLRPDRPLFNVPALRFFIARPTLADAFFEYFRAMNILPVAGK
jgi:hypothetical protein